MLFILCCFNLNLILVSGSSLSDLIVQTPVETFNHSGETAKISCSHSIKDYDRILWYKQSESRELQLLGYMIGDYGYPEPGLTMEGSANKDKSCSLTIKDLSLSSSAVYFCAASYHSRTSHSSSVQKPPDQCFCDLCITAHPPAPAAHNSLRMCC